jgi:hypothetical protein
MLNNTYFFNDTMEKYILLFGRMFDNVRIQRSTAANTALTQDIIVPIAYGGREKYIARNLQDPNIERPVAIQLPRMAYEMTDFYYDDKRQLPYVGNVDFVPTPYKFVFNLYITGRYVMDAAKIVEQIAPFFRPSVGIRADLLGDGNPYDLKLTLAGKEMKDNYEGSFMDRRVMIWTLTFVLDGWMFGPQASNSNSVIRWVSTGYATDTVPGTTFNYTTNTFPTEANTALINIQPTDPYIIQTDFTGIFDE